VSKRVVFTDDTTTPPTKYPVDVEFCEAAGEGGSWWNWRCPICKQKNYYLEIQCRKCKRSKFKVRERTGPRGGKHYRYVVAVDESKVPSWLIRR
jgi:hypothetical protein